MADKNQFGKEIDLLSLLELSELKLIRDFLFTIGLFAYGVFLFLVIGVLAYGYFQTNWQNIIRLITGLGLLVGGISLIHVSRLLKKKIKKIENSN